MMRCALVLLLLALVAPPAFAQHAAGLSGFRLGMSAAEARSVAPELTPFIQNRRGFVLEGHDEAIGDLRLPLRLTFVGGTLGHIGGGLVTTTSSGEACLEQLQAVVVALEQSVG